MEQTSFSCCGRRVGPTELRGQAGRSDFANAAGSGRITRKTPLAPPAAFYEL